ncbi:alpha/beta hydrolase [Sphingomonas sp. DT-204]|uniref:alpha/beta hydrolase n=1 Tax=Sphingomonas sp. DT-204 TaxID=3396166 RepID=UPI003F1C2E8A
MTLLSRLMFVLLGVTIAFASSARAQDNGRFVEIAAMPSANIAPPHVTVWLPPGYDGGKRRYGVLYMHDGQNLFDPDLSAFKKVWGVDASIRRLVAAKKIAPVIVVGIWNPGVDRYRQYLPRALHDAASPRLRAELDRLAGGPVLSDAYLRFIVEELKPRIDRDYRTLPGRDHTAIAGSSMGGLISLAAIARYPRVFGRAALVSTHWPLGDPANVGRFSPEVAALWRSYLDRHLGAPSGRRIWSDRGTATLDAAYGPYQEAIDADFARLGWKRGRDYESRVYPGAAHEELSWAARLEEVLGWLLAPR